MLVDPFRFTIALIPVAAYLVVLGLVNLRRRPLVVSGGSDLCALGVALSGLMLIGPIEMLRPEAATAQFGNYIWPVLLVFYWLWLLLVVLVQRPRLVVYHVNSEELHSVLAEAASRLDADSRWAGRALSMPNLGVHLYLESFDLMRCVSLASFGRRQDLDGWQKLARELGAATKPVRVKPNPQGVGFLVAATLLVVGSLLHLVSHPVELARAVEQVFAY